MWTVPRCFSHWISECVIPLLHDLSFIVPYQKTREKSSAQLLLTQFICCCFVICWLQFTFSLFSKQFYCTDNKSFETTLEIITKCLSQWHSLGSYSKINTDSRSSSICDALFRHNRLTTTISISIRSVAVSSLIQVGGTRKERGKTWHADSHPTIVGSY